MDLKIILIILIININNVRSEKFDSDILKNYSEFFNFGSKKIVSKLDRTKYENAIIKSKVDILGSVFKTNVDALKLYGILDLIFLIDASSSVGEYNFKSELKFVKKLLSDVTVDYNHTRVAVVTFSSQSSVIKNIDEISKPKQENNKCLLLNNEINNIKYTGGGTYTVGAFEMALDIFKSSRVEAKKVLFLITDGFSNGGDPVPIANKLKENLVTIFTIGISNGNFKELFELSTSPGELYSYLLDSFEEFESLARRALHVDLQSGDYIPLGTSTPCNKLCNSTNCCDDNALCTCGTSTGHYSCLCGPGYYGSGLKNSCSPCPSGSYSSGPNLCLPCPDVHHFSSPPASGINSCQCKSGYQATDNYACEVIKCKKVYAPENGYFVKRKDCSNVLNSACGVRCNVGYTLIGSSIRLCQSNASWSGYTPSCQIRTCDGLNPPPHGSIICKHSDLDEIYTSESHLPVDTICSFSCERGRTLVGSIQRNCLPLARWDGLKTSCKQIKCNKLTKIHFGNIEPKSCLIGKQPFGKTCKFVCNDGYDIVGANEKICNGQHGTWDNNNEIICKDTTKPNLICPENITGHTLKGKQYGTVNWGTPNITDNSGQNVTIWTKPAIKNRNNFKFKIGTTKVTYFAQDTSSNIAKCSFIVEIQDLEFPTIEGCANPPAYLSIDNKPVNISWDEPNIFDNSQNVTIIKNHEFGVFNIGTHLITYLASDPSNNVATCFMNITIQESLCDLIPDPMYGHSDCKPFSDSIHCVITCEEGYALPLNNPIDTFDIDNGTSKYVCQHNNPVWNNQEGGVFPECSVTEVPTEIVQKGVISIEPEIDLDDPCKNKNKLNEIENEIKKTLESNILEDCNGFNCNIKTEAECDETEGQEENTNIIKREINLKKTNKRKRKKINIKFQLHAKNKGLKNSTKIVNFRDRIKNIKVFRGNNITHNFDLPKIICPIGSFSRKMRCVRCSEGTFHNITANNCQSCQIGYYNDKSAQTICTHCPKYFSTRKLHAKSLEDCIEQCLPGTVARKKQIKHPKNHPNSVIERATLRPYCTSCPFGYYQPNYGELTCLQCPEGYTTVNRGAIHLNECILQEHICNVSNICNKGTCVMENDFYYSCNCDQLYFGSNCEFKLDYCASNPCQNDGKCLTTTSGYECTCSKGFKGKYCTELIDDCKMNCSNNGICAHSDEDDLCLCPKGFGGNNCEIKLQYCYENICENGGICNEDNNGFICECKNGFIGRRCSYLPCDYHPCPDKSICINFANESIKANYRCQCLPGLAGDNCTEIINNCVPNKCQNNGECINEQDTYKCNCKKGFNGVNCENKLNSNYILNFPRSGITDYINLLGFNRNISEISVCLWMKTNDNFNYGTILSYATKDNDNAFTITDYTGLVLYINNNYIVTDVLLNDGFWHHFCVTWSNSEGVYFVYLDGNIIQNGTGLSQNQNIEGFGKLVIGQEQDILGGKFSQSEAFLGKITYLDIWSKALNANTVESIMNSCDDAYFGDLYAWPEFALNIKGDIQIENSSFCKKCEYPPPLYNGLIDVVENIAYYKCNQGFYLSDTSYILGRKCNKAGLWEGTTNPYCKALNCGHPGYTQNGFITGKRFTYLDEVVYECNSGFNLTGAKRRVCSENATWVPDKPKCLGIQCKKFAQPINSQITVYMDDDFELDFDEFDAFDVGAQLDFICIKKSIIQGENILNCLNNGSWDFPPPNCILEEAKPTPIPCTLEHIPKAPVNGYMLPESMAIVVAGKSNIIEYKCRDGYKAFGENSSTCIIDGYWSELKMTCKAKTCGAPPTFKNMVPKIFGPNQMFYVGNMITYDCIEGYKSFANTRVRCLVAGQWGNMPGKCIRVSCRKPTIGENTVINGTSYLYNDEVTLDCDGAIYKLFCNSKGQWIGARGPEC